MISPRAVLAAAGLIALAVVLGAMGYVLFRREVQPFAGFGVNPVGRTMEIAPHRAPDFTLYLFNGGTLRVAELGGQAVIVNFWASWCPPCRDEARTLEAVSRQYRDRGVVFVGVNVWEAEADARRFLQEFGVTYANGPDPMGRIVIEYGVTGLPETFGLTRDGLLVRRWIGPMNRSEAEAFVETLLQ